MPAKGLTIVPSPGGPSSISNATAGLLASETLPVPITVNGSGSLPTAIAWDYLIDGGSTWTAGTDDAFPSPSLG